MYEMHTFCFCNVSFINVEFTNMEQNMKSFYKKRLNRITTKMI